MAAKKYLQLVAGRIKEIAATVVSAGAADDGKIPALDASGRLDSSVLPVGIGADTKALTASEALAAGDVVNLWNDASTLKARKADATAEGKEADGFVIAAVANGASATVYFEGRITGLSGLTLGAMYWMATTPGQVTATAPSAAGNVVQMVGKAVSATEINFEPQQPVTVS